MKSDDDFLIKAQREVDEMLPGTPRIAPPPVRPGWQPKPTPTPAPGEPHGSEHGPFIGSALACFMLALAVCSLIGSGVAIWEKLEINERDINLLHERLYEARRQMLRSEQDAETMRVKAAACERSVDRAIVQIDEALRPKKGRRR